MIFSFVRLNEDAIDRIKLGKQVYGAVFMGHIMPGMDSMVKGE